MRDPTLILADIDLIQCGEECRSPSKIANHVQSPFPAQSQLIRTSAAHLRRFGPHHGRDSKDHLERTLPFCIPRSQIFR